MHFPPEGFDALDAVLAPTGYTCNLDYASCGVLAKPKLSCGSASITDAYLRAKDDTPLFTVRPENWNEKFLEVLTDDVGLFSGNCDSVGELRNITLRHFLRKPTDFGAAYTGLNNSTDLSKEIFDAAQVRFETVFLPMERVDGRGAIQFAVETYSKTSQSEQDPRNLMLLATTDGLSIQADGANAKRILLHMSAENDVHEYWLKMKKSKYENVKRKVAATGGGDLHGRKRTEIQGIGIEALRKRSNVLMVIQVPVQFMNAAADVGCFCCGRVLAHNEQSGPSSAIGTPVVPSRSNFGSHLNMTADPGSASVHSSVSRGDFYRKYKGLTKNCAKRRTEQVSVTCVLINTVAGGIPSEADVLAAVTDMETLYKSSSASRLLKLFGSANVAGVPQRNGVASARAPVSSSVQDPVPSSAHPPPGRAAWAQLSRVERTKLFESSIPYPNNVQLAQNNGVPSVQAPIALSVQSSMSSSVQTSVTSSVQALDATSAQDPTSPSVQAPIVLSQNTSVASPGQAPIAASVRSPVPPSLPAPAVRSAQDRVAPSVEAPTVSSVHASIASSVQASVAPSMQTSIAPSVQPHVATTVQAPVATPVHASVTPSTSSKLSRLHSVRDIVMTKLKGLYRMPALSHAAVLEMRLLVLGAVPLESVKTLLESKFDSLRRTTSCNSDSGAKKLLLELELLILGAFDLLTRDAS